MINFSKWSKAKRWKPLVISSHQDRSDELKESKIQRVVVRYEEHFMLMPVLIPLSHFAVVNDC